MESLDIEFKRPANWYDFLCAAALGGTSRCKLMRTSVLNLLDDYTIRKAKVDFWRESCPYSSTPFSVIAPDQPMRVCSSRFLPPPLWHGQQHLAIRPGEETVRAPAFLLPTLVILESL